MSLDLKIERFGLELFNRLFSDYEVEGYSPQPLPDIYAEEESELNEDIVRAVKVFMGFFHSYYVEMHDVVYGEFKSNLMDFVDILIVSFPHHQLLDEGILQFVASCAFVADLCLIGFKKHGEYSFLRSAHLMWAMFVDLKLKDYFHLLGGWRELRRVSYGLRSLYGFLRDYNETNKNFLSFKYERLARSVGGMTVFSKQVKNDGGDPLALQWADYVTHVQHPAFDPDKIDIALMEDSMSKLRWYVDPHGIQDHLATNVPLMAAKSGMSEKECLDALANSTAEQHPELFNMVDLLYSELKRKNELHWKDFYDSYRSIPDPSTVVFSAQDGVINVDHISSGTAIDKPLVTDTVDNPQLAESNIIDKPPRDSEDFNASTSDKPIINPDKIEQDSHAASPKVASSFSDRPRDTQPEAVIDHRENLISEFQKCFPRLMSSMLGSLSNNKAVEENLN